MCRQDPHYKPRTTRNPFAALSHFAAGKKFLGNFSSCCEIPSPFVESSAAESPRSLPGSPTASRRAPPRPPLFAHPLFKGGSSTNLSELNEGGANPALRRRGSCESGFYSSVGECLSPSSLWDSGTAVGVPGFEIDGVLLGCLQVSSLRSLDELEPAELQALCKRASSIYTDSSEDISSLAGSDWAQDLQPKIRTFVEYYEGKGEVGIVSGGWFACRPVKEDIYLCENSLS